MSVNKPGTRIADEVDAFQHMLADAIATIPGTRNPKVEVDQRNEFVLSFDGWSPVLADVWIRSPGILSPGGVVTPYLDQVLDTQRARAAEARILHERETPFDPKDPEVLGMLLVDREIQSILGKDRVREMVTRGLVEQHERSRTSSAGYYGANSMQNSSMHIIEMSRNDGTGLSDRIVGIGVKLSGDDLPTSIVFNGSSFCITGQSFPQSVVAAMEGRPVGDILELPADLDPDVRNALASRTVLSAQYARGVFSGERELTIITRPVLRIPV